ncbi:unnamed protein product [Rotaria socialis]|uniref:Uncharacterized protein n=1 Tax=Rotaria socialis TaxID=392032 RepID=A0A817Y7R5_9BILA|nr:unnamed protein product [Rotaria socialis]
MTLTKLGILTLSTILLLAKFSQCKDGFCKRLSFDHHYAAGPLGVIHEQIYNCDNNPKNEWKGYCILPKPDAIIHCNKDPHCGGYEETMDIASLTADGIAAVRQYQSAYGKSAVQLFLAGSKTIPSSNWRCFNKVYSEPHAAHKHNHKANGIDEQC